MASPPVHGALKGWMGRQVTSELLHDPVFRCLEQAYNGQSEIQPLSTSETRQVYRALKNQTLPPAFLTNFQFIIRKAIESYDKSNEASFADYLHLDALNRFVQSEGLTNEDRYLRDQETLRLRILETHNAVLRRLQESRVRRETVERQAEEKGGRRSREKRKKGREQTRHSGLLQTCKCKDWRRL